jgi:transposase-like protein
MVDKDLKEINAIREVFPRAAVLLCWFHVLQVCYFNIIKGYSSISHKF